MKVDLRVSINPNDRANFITILALNLQYKGECFLIENVLYNLLYNKEVRQVLRYDEQCITGASSNQMRL